MIDYVIATAIIGYFTFGGYWSGLVQAEMCHRTGKRPALSASLWEVATWPLGLIQGFIEGRRARKRAAVARQEIAELPNAQENPAAFLRGLREILARTASTDIPRDPEDYHPEDDAPFRVYESIEMRDGPYGSYWEHTYKGE